MAVFRAEGVVLGDSGADLGSGMASIHLPRGREREQEAAGTVSLQAWEARDDPPVALKFADGRVLAICVSRDALSECSRNRILRFTARWTPEPAAGPEG